MHFYYVKPHFLKLIFLNDMSHRHEIQHFYTLPTQQANTCLLMTRKGQLLPTTPERNKTLDVKVSDLAGAARKHLNKNKKLPPLPTVIFYRQEKHSRHALPESAASNQLCPAYR